MIGTAREHMKTQQLHQVLNCVWAVVADANRYFARRSAVGAGQDRSGAAGHGAVRDGRNSPPGRHPGPALHAGRRPRSCSTCSACRRPRRVRRLRRSGAIQAGASAGAGPVFPRYVEPRREGLKPCWSTAIAIWIFRTSPTSSTAWWRAPSAAGVGRMVTISTRVTPSQVCWRSPSDARTSSARSARIRTMPHEELDIEPRSSCGCRRASQGGGDRRGRARLSLRHSPREAQEQGFRTHIAAARETGLPLVIHARDADDDMAQILEEESGKGAFPAVLHCFTGGRELAHDGDRARALRLVLRHPDVQEIRCAARHRR